MTARSEPSPHSATKTLHAHLLLLGVVVVWGATFPLVKSALVDASPLLFNLLRMALATIALGALNLRQLRNLSRQSVSFGITAGIFLGAGYQLQTAGLARTSPTKSAFITGFVVIFVALLTAVPVLRPAHAPHFRWTVALGAALAFAGLALLTTPPRSSLTEMITGVNFGDVLTLLCALAFAGHLIVLSQVSHGTSAGALATLQISCATVLMLLTLHGNGPVHLHITFRLCVALLITSLLATAAAFTIQSWAQQHLPATHTAALLTLEPVFALLTSVLFFHEHLTRRTCAGAALIFAGIFVIEQLGTPIPPEPVLGRSTTVSPPQ